MTFSKMNSPPSTAGLFSESSPSRRCFVFSFIPYIVLRSRAEKFFAQKFSSRGFAILFQYLWPAAFEINTKAPLTVDILLAVTYNKNINECKKQGG